MNDLEVYAALAMHALIRSQPHLLHEAQRTDWSSLPDSGVIGPGAVVALDAFTIALDMVDRARLVEAEEAEEDEPI